MGNTVAPAQRFLIDRLQKQVVVVPDSDSSGYDLVKQAIANNWSVSFPEWEPGIKDVNDAIKTYGKLATLHSIITNICSNPLKVQLLAKSRYRKQEDQ